MSLPSSYDTARGAGLKILESIENHQPELSPLDATAAMAIALGGMVASMAEMGMTKPGRSGAMLKKLFDLAEQVAAESLGAQ
jgi:hypothetical protein